MLSLNVLLVDDHPLFLEGLQNLLEARQVVIVGAAKDGHEALDKVRLLKPDVVLMDIQMPNCDGLEATRLIKTEFPATKIVILTMSADDEHLFEAVKSGASGYLLKSIEPERFFDLLEGLERGEAAMSQDLATKVLAEFANQPSEVEETEEESESHELTERQLQVLQLAAQGWTNKEIAKSLIITERTVKYHMREILQKLHLRNRSQVVAFAMQKGLIDPSTILSQPRN
ncbi:MAG: response regulator transcription factor [Chloroflexota bacterium]